MPIIFSTTTPASPACQPPARIYFEAPDDALLARVTEKVAEMMGRHLSYTFHDEAPGGVTPIILEDVGPSAQPSPAAQALSAGPEAIAKLRHLYQNMVNGAVRDTASAKRIAEGLLAPAIEALERATPPAEQQAAPKAAPGVGNSGFDHKTAADLLNNKTVSDEAVRKFVATSRWAHDERAAPKAAPWEQNESAYQRGYMDGMAKGRRDVDAAPNPAPAPLSDAQIAEMMRDTWGCASIAPRHALEFARAVERAHGIAQKGGS